MASRNRKGYSGSRRGNGSVLQSVGLMIFLGVTCFFLGFFVLARLMPLKDGPEKQGISTIATNTGDPPDRPLSSGMSSPPTNDVPATSPARQPSIKLTPTPPKQETPDTSVPGPSIEPADGNKVQQPEGVDNATPTVDPKGQDEANGNPPLTDTPLSPHRRRHRKSSETIQLPADDTAASPPDKIAADPGNRADDTSTNEVPAPLVPKHHRRKPADTSLPAPTVNGTDDTSTTDTPVPPVPKHHRRKSTDTSRAAITLNGTDDTTSTDTPVPATPRPKRRRSKYSAALQSATELNGTDATNGDEVPAHRPPSTDDVNETSRSVQTPSSPETSADPAPPVRTHSGYYHVQTGLFTTQEAADAEVKRVQEKNISVTVQKVQRDGRTLYRVQHAIYRHRANAEAARKRLQDAGIDATISGP